MIYRRYETDIYKLIILKIKLLLFNLHDIDKCIVLQIRVYNY